MKRHTLALTLVSTTLTTVMVSVHHIFRLGPDVIAPALILIALPLVLFFWLGRTGSTVALWSLAILNALIFAWFGVLDGILDHVLKGVGAENVTILPGGDQEIVATVYSLGSPEASALFYEGTGIIQAIASIAMIVFTVRLVVQHLAAAAAAPTAAARAGAH